MPRIKIPKTIAPAASETPASYRAPIHQWNEDDRPREKMQRLGVRALSDSELIGLIFGTGAHTKQGAISAVELGKVLLQTFRSLAQISKRDVQELQRVSGIGPAKAIQLAAAFEIGRRVESSVEADRVKIQSPADVAQRYGPQMRDLPMEVFKVVMLNNANVIISDYDLHTGGLNASIVDPRRVFQRALLDNAASIICLHNHPSGNPEPSREDLNITRQLVQAGALLNIRVHDNLIIAGRTFTSFAERGLLGS